MPVTMPPATASPKRRRRAGTKRYRSITTTVVTTSGTDDPRHLAEQAVLEADVLGEAADEPRDHLREDGERERDDQERAGAGHEHEVDELRADGRTPPLHLQRRLEAGPERGHHPRRGPDEDEQREHAERARRAREPRDRVLDRLRALGPRRAASRRSS